jgi:membrane protein YqaA with SNARE-associated domain
MARGTMIYAGLFLSAFTSATLLPGSSEAALLVLLAAGTGHPVLLIVVATIGNVSGSVVNWFLGRFMFHLRDRPWLPFGSNAYERAICRFQSYGFWLLLLSWVPVVGDPLTLAAGILRIPFLPFILIVSIGKAGRYMAILAAFTWWSG